jgi:hypothetical protein
MYPFGYIAEQSFVTQLTFWRIILTPSSGSKNKKNEKTAWSRRHPFFLFGLNFSMKMEVTCCSEISIGFQQTIVWYSPQLSGKHIVAAVWPVYIIHTSFRVGKVCELTTSQFVQVKLSARHSQLFKRFPGSHLGRPRQLCHVADHSSHLQSRLENACIHNIPWWSE